MNVDGVVHDHEGEWLIPTADVVEEAASSAPGGQLADCFDSPRKNTTGTIALIEKGVADDIIFCEQEDQSTSSSSIEDAVVEVDGIVAPIDTRPRRSISVEEETTDALALLKQHGKHVFVLSEAGKPIYTTHGSEEDLSALFALIHALVSFMTARDDTLHSFQYGRLTICFTHRGPLILAAVSRVGESRSQLNAQLDLVHNQILSVLTRTALMRVFEQRGHNFDLRRLLQGTEKSLGTAVVAAEMDPAVSLNAVRVLPMASSDRDTLGQAIVSSVNACKVKNLVFGIVVVRRQLVTMVRMKKYALHPADLHIVLNLVACNPSFKNVESWSPICLPRFDDSGFLHAHISYLSDSCPACLLLLTVDRHAFYALSEVKKKLVEKLSKSKSLTALTAACNGARCFDLDEMFNTGVAQNVPGRFASLQLGYADLWHFVYKNRTSSQLCSAMFRPPFISSDERQQLIDSYARLADRVHDRGDDGPLKILFRPGDRQTLLAWVTPNFELYSAFSPFVQKQSAVSKIDRLLKALKKEEDRLFLVSTQTF